MNFNFPWTTIEFSKEHPEITLTAIVPTLNHHHTYSESERARCQTILDRADSVIVLDDIDSSNDKPHSKLNNLLIANSSEVIVYSDGNNSEMTSLIIDIEREGLEMFNLYDELEDYFSLQYNAKQFLQRFPNVQSFRYGREGVIFEGHNRPYPVHFGEIKAIKDRRQKLYMPKGIYSFCRRSKLRFKYSYSQYRFLTYIL